MSPPMTAPSIKEALELLPCPFCGGEAESDSQRHYRNISTGNLEKSAAIYCTSCNADMTWCYRDTPEIEREQVMSLLIEQWNTRATLQPSGERREAIARAVRSVLMDGLESNYPGNWLVPMDSEDIGDLCEYVADTILASGLVQDDPTTSKKEVVGLVQDEAWDSRAEFEKVWAKRPWLTYEESDKDRAFRWWSEAIRSARNGGAS